MPQPPRITPVTLALSFRTPSIALIFTDNKHKKRRVRRFQIPLTGDNAEDICNSLTSSFPQYLGPSVVPTAQLTRLIQRLLNQFKDDENSDGGNLSSAEHASLYSGIEPTSPPAVLDTGKHTENSPTKPAGLSTPDTRSHNDNEALDAKDDELMALLSDIESRTAAPTRSRASKSQGATSTSLSSLPPVTASSSLPFPSFSSAVSSDSPSARSSKPVNPRGPLVPAVTSSLPASSPVTGSALGPLSSLPPLAARPKLSSLPPLTGGPGPSRLPKPATVNASPAVTQVFIPTSTATSDDEDLNRVSPRVLAAKKAEMEQAFKSNQITKGDSEFVYDKRAEFGPAKEKSEWDDDADETDTVTVTATVVAAPPRAAIPLAESAPAKVEEPVDLDISEDLDIEAEEDEEEDAVPPASLLDKKSAPESAQKASGSVLSSLLGLPIAEGLKVVRNSDEAPGYNSDENAENDILF